MTRRAQRHVWVVMANDFPECCFASESLADDFCMQANAKDRGEQKASLQSAPRGRVYYRWYKLELQV